MERKARENLQAAALLARADDPFPNASASRAYYAVYLAAWEHLVSQGEGVPATRDGRRYFRHDTLPGLLGGVLSDTERADLEYLRGLRVSADYREDELVRSQAAEAAEIADRLVARILDAEGREAIH